MKQNEIALGLIIGVGLLLLVLIFALYAKPSVALLLASFRLC